MVLAAALEQVRHEVVFDHEVDGVYFFSEHFPEYDARMEAIGVAARMWLQWDESLKLEG